MLHMLVCDLDGTLLMHGRPFDPDDVRKLQALGAEGVVRVIATGRALATAKKVVPAAFPIDYLIFSSGAGILDWRSQSLLVAHALNPDETRQAVDVLLAHQLDFMLHAPIPDQHIFYFHRTGKPNADFARRLARHAADGRVFDIGVARRRASQLLAISPHGDPIEPYESIRAALSRLSVIRATSPLDGHSMWIEVFAPTVSKSQAAAWIARAHGLAAAHVWAIGNDYNDWDLLRWAGRAAVLQDAPESLRAEFSPVTSLAAWLDAEF
jgi:hydroxymethylpyrimidine pyrophosphatase-like HAD family hydrolase